VAAVANGWRTTDQQLSADQGEHTGGIRVFDVMRAKPFLERNGFPDTAMRSVGCLNGKSMPMPVSK
jgi:hypothetical protein